MSRSESRKVTSSRKGDFLPGSEFRKTDRAVLSEDGHWKTSFENLKMVLTTLGIAAGAINKATCRKGRPSRKGLDYCLEENRDSRASHLLMCYFEYSLHLSPNQRQNCIQCAAAEGCICLVVFERSPKKRQT